MKEDRGRLRRAVALGLLVGAGTIVGVAGSRWSGSDAWFLAIPVVLAIGWLVRADPTRCADGHDRGADADR